MLTHEQYVRRSALVKRIVFLVVYMAAVAAVFLDIVVWRP